MYFLKPSRWRWRADLLFWKRIGDHQAEAQFAFCTTREECKIVKITDKEANAGDLEVKWWWVQLNFRRQQASIVFAFQSFVVYCRFCFYGLFHCNIFIQSNFKFWRVYKLQTSYFFFSTLILDACKRLLYFFVKHDKSMKDFIFFNQW